jgi:hypothetical protein
MRRSFSPPYMWEPYPVCWPGTGEDDREGVPLCPFSHDIGFECASECEAFERLPQYKAQATGVCGERSSLFFFSPPSAHVFDPEFRLEAGLGEEALLCRWRPWRPISAWKRAIQIRNGEEVSSPEVGVLG